jgi:hypothetical protein
MLLYLLLLLALSMTLWAPWPWPSRLSGVSDTRIPPTTGTDAVFGPSDAGLVWLVHLTDLHLSVLEPERTKRFDRFCTDVQSWLRPRGTRRHFDIRRCRAVFLTKIHRPHSLFQLSLFRATWCTRRRPTASRCSCLPSGRHTAPRSLNTASGIPIGTISPFFSQITKARSSNKIYLFTGSRWMDVLGNHDTRNTDTAATLAWTRRFTVSRYHDRSATSCFSQDRLAIVALEQTPRPSTHRFFNFFGITSAAATVPLPACARAPGVTVVAFGHYPLFMVDDRPDAVTAVGDAVGDALSGTARPRAPVPALATAVAYLCGHLHDGLGDFLHTRYLRILRNKASAANLLIPRSLIASGTHRASLNSKASTLNYVRPIASWPLTAAFSRFSTRHSMPRGLAFWYARALLYHRHVDAVHT